jgi:hypothetical protein
MDVKPSRSPDEQDEVREEEHEALRCRDCGSEIADIADICSIGGAPTLQHFANPAGALWEILTVRKARGLVADIQAYGSFTWFPGYTWRAVACADCRLHMGWMYEGAQTPPVFFGLVRGHLVGG